jgi:hypothetical protein
VLLADVSPLLVIDSEAARTAATHHLHGTGSWVDSTSKALHNGVEEPPNSRLALEVEVMAELGLGGLILVLSGVVVVVGLHDRCAHIEEDPQVAEGIIKGAQVADLALEECHNKGPAVGEQAQAQLGVELA